MASVANNVMRFFRGSSAGPAEATSKAPAQKLTRRSSGMGEVARTLSSQDSLCVLDLGATSASNIRFFTERGHKYHSDDLLVGSMDSALAMQDENGNRVLDEKRFLADNLAYEGALFDIVFCWNLPDYLDESLVKPVVGRLWSVLKPGGMLLAFFHTRDAGPDSPCHRFHIVGGDTLEMKKIELRREARRGPTGAVHTAIDGFQLQRVFNNRHIENLFRDFASIKFFLARDNIREVLVVR